MDKIEEYYEISEDSKTLKLPDEMVLPSEEEHTKKEKKKKFKKRLKPFKYSTLLFFIILIYLFYEKLLELFFEYLRQNPTLYDTYLYIYDQITNLTLTGLFFFSILSTLFFLILPSEATFLYYIDLTSHFFLFIILFCLLGNAVGMSINYFFGRLMGERVLLKMFKEKDFYKYKTIIEKYGGYMLFFGNIFPGPIEFIAVFYGGFKFSYKRYLYLAMMGRLIKYVLLFIAYTFWWDQITFHYDKFLGYFEIFKFW